MSSLVRPFRGLRPAPEYAAEVAAPPYDVLSSAEARQRAAGKPWSFLHISKPEIDLPEDTDPYADAVYAKGAENLERMIREGILVRDLEPHYYVYRLRMGEHEQTGVVLTGSLAAYEANRIRKHEFTRPQKEDDRVRQITALGAQTGPVLLAYRAEPRLRELLAAETAREPLYDIVADDGIGHQLWRIDRHDVIARLTALFDAMDALYIADGHHRSAAAARVAAERRARAGHASGDASWEYFLCVAFPHDEMQILDYNRVVRDLNGLDERALLAAIGERFSVQRATAAVHPARPGEFGMYLAGHWYRLAIDPRRVPRDDPVASLDVSLLQDQLLGPILGIGDPRQDQRIDFVGGIRGLDELERRVDRGDMAVAFSLYPTSMEALMAVADANEVMPPKSTWFEPKLADGLVSHLLD
ncbi:MAG: DUF1015 domain-containing protein [Gammaproteobacteria bacterium]|nr:MAG: DUF1015 domain-containing protein [Gammaproteobacteria bacterium]